MALPPKQEVFLNHMAIAADQDVIQFLGKNTHPMRQFFESYYTKLDYPLLIDTLNSNDARQIEQTRDFMSDCFDCHKEKIAYDKIRFPTFLERKIARLEGTAGLGDKIRKTGQNLRDKKFGRVLYKNLAEIYALSTSHMGITVGERQALLANALAWSIKGVAPTIAGSFMMASTTTNAALPTDIKADAPRTSLEINANAPQPQGSVLAYTPVSGNFKGAAKSIENILHHNNTTPSQYYYSPFLVNHLKTSTEARKFVKWITEAAVKHNLDPVRFTNQMYRESAQFNPKYVYGPGVSSAGAMGLGQQIKTTGAKYGLKGKDFFNPYKSINVAARIMSDLKGKYFNDQGLAEIGYNGGEGAIHFVQKN